MCAATAGYRGRRVLVLDHANKPGKKILMSGGGRCNFTNLNSTPANFLSDNPHYCISALKRYTPQDFLELVDRHGVEYEEKAPGQLFCRDSAKDVLNVLLTECEWAGAEIRLKTQIQKVREANGGYQVVTGSGVLSCESLVVACGGLSIPTMGATGFGYELARKFGLNILPTRAGLVPFTLQPHDKEKLAELSGIAVECCVSNERIQFNENMLFTHRGLSGPAILQISSYWQAGEAISINLLPALDLVDFIKKRQAIQPNIKLKTALTDMLPKRLIPAVLGQATADKPLQELSQVRMEAIAKQLQHWQIKPNGTEGYRTAEVTLGGVDCNELSSKTMESGKVAGLYFIGEVVDVTGWLGGYNFQWAWSSGWCAGQVV